MLLQPIRLCLHTFVRAHISKTARSLLNVSFVLWLRAAVEWCSSGGVVKCITLCASGFATTT